MDVQPRDAAKRSRAIYAATEDEFDFAVMMKTELGIESDMSKIIYYIFKEHEERTEKQL